MINQNHIVCCSLGIVGLVACTPQPAPAPKKPARAPITPVFLDTPQPKPLELPDIDSPQPDQPAPQKPDAATVRQQRDHIIALLDEGRARVKRGDYAAGITSYQEALIIDPNHARLLSELGWAAFKDNQLELADKATRLSVRHASSPAVKGASLYNLGRIAEARAQTELAATHYRHSLDVRPGNATVTQRLDALLAQGVTPQLEDDCDFASHAQKLDHAISALELCQRFTSLAPDACSTEQPDTPALEIGEFTVRTFATEPEEDGGHTRFIYVAVLGTSTWYSSLTGIEYNPGVGYIHDTLEITGARARALIPDTELPQAIITIDHDYTDGDYPQNEAVYIDIKLEALLDLNGPTPRWVASVLVHHSEAIDKMIDEEDGIDHGKFFPRQHTSHYTLAWGEEGYTTTLEQGRLHPKSPAGTYSYTRPLRRCPASHDFLL